MSSRDARLGPPRGLGFHGSTCGLTSVESSSLSRLTVCKAGRFNMERLFMRLPRLPLLASRPRCIEPRSRVIGEFEAQRPSSGIESSASSEGGWLVDAGEVTRTGSGVWITSLGTYVDRSFANSALNTFGCTCAFKSKSMVCRRSDFSRGSEGAPSGSSITRDLTCTNDGDLSVSSCTLFFRGLSRWTLEGESGTLSHCLSACVDGSALLLRLLSSNEGQLRCGRRRGSLSLLSVPSVTAGNT